jgi:hypothetical protein
MWCDVGYPQKGRDTQYKSNEERLQRAFPIDSARQQKIEPNQARVMGLDCEADRQAKDTGRYKSIPHERPGSHNAKAYGDSSGIPGGKDKFAAGKQDANQEEGDAGRIIGANLTHEDGGKDEYTGDESEPKRLRSAPRQHRKWSHKEEYSGQVNKESNNLVALG